MLSEKSISAQAEWNALELLLMIKTIYRSKKMLVVWRLAIIVHRMSWALFHS